MASDRRVIAAAGDQLVARSLANDLVAVGLNRTHFGTIVEPAPTPGAARADVCGPWQTGKGRHAIMGYHVEVLPMTDMLIRDVPDDVVAAVDARASRLGLSRSEYVRRRLAQDATTTGTPVSVQDLARFTEVFGDLDDPEVMSQAWR